MKHRRRWIILLVLLLVVPSCRDVVQRRFGTWPKVESRAELVADCANLLRLQANQAPLDDSGRALSKTDWPASITRLQPRSVTLYPGVVFVFIHSGGIGPSVGYVVVPDEANTPDRWRRRNTRRYQQGIYFWESIE